MKIHTQSALAVIAAVLLSSSATSSYAAGTSPSNSAGHDSDLELTQKLNNPVASLVLVPIQMNFDFHAGDGNGWRNTNNVQPVVPIKLSEKFTLITRTIIPYVYQEDRFFRGSGVQQGLADTTMSLFVSPNTEKGKPIWGVGPGFLIPTATQDLLGTKQWGAGPSAILLKQTSRWTYGGLITQTWAFAGDKDRTYGFNYHGSYLGVPIHGGVNVLFMQPFVSYVTPKMFTLTLTSESTINWKAKPGQQWTVPIDGVVSHLVHAGKLKMNLVGGVRWYAVRPDNSPTWGVRFVVAFIL